MKPDLGTDRGAAIVETALVINLLLVLVLGAISFGVLLAHRHSLQEAAAEGARAAALASYDHAAHDPDDPDHPARVAARQAMSNLAPISEECDSEGAVPACEIEISPCEGSPGDCVAIEIVHDRSEDPIVGSIPLVPLPGQITASAVAVVHDG